MTIATSPSEQEVPRHFDEFPALVEPLRAWGKDEQTAKVERAPAFIHPVGMIQNEPLGLGMLWVWLSLR